MDALAESPPSTEPDALLSGSPAAIDPLDSAPRLRFFRHSQTINEEHILDVLDDADDHGEYVLHATESSLCRRFHDWSGKCFFADILAVYKKDAKDYLIGIEIKDWKNTVHPKMCYEYLQTYRTSCEYFYIAARKFSQTLASIDEIGLINIDTMKVVKPAKYLYPDKEYRMEVVRRLKRITRTTKNILEDPYQLSLERWQNE